MRGAEFREAVSNVDELGKVQDEHPDENRRNELEELLKLIPPASDPKQTGLDALVSQKYESMGFPQGIVQRHLGYRTMLLLLQDGWSIDPVQAMQGRYLLKSNVRDQLIDRYRDVALSAALSGEDCHTPSSRRGWLEVCRGSGLALRTR
jgi:hypothetical protein